MESLLIFNLSSLLRISSQLWTNLLSSLCESVLLSFCHLMCMFWFLGRVSYFSVLLQSFLVSMNTLLFAVVTSILVKPSSLNLPMIDPAHDGCSLAEVTASQPLLALRANPPPVLLQTPDGSFHRSQKVLFLDQQRCQFSISTVVVCQYLPARTTSCYPCSSGCTKTQWLFRIRTNFSSPNSLKWSFLTKCAIYHRHTQNEPSTIQAGKLLPLLLSCAR